MSYLFDISNPESAENLKTIWFKKNISWLPIKPIPQIILGLNTTSTKQRDLEGAEFSDAISLVDHFTRRLTTLWNQPFKLTYYEISPST